MDIEHVFIFIVIILSILCFILFWNAFSLGDMGERIHRIEARNRLHIENSEKVYSCLEQIASSLESLEETALEVRQLALLTETQLDREEEFYDEDDKKDFEGPLQ